MAAQPTLTGNATFGEVINSDPQYWAGLGKIDKFNVAQDFFLERMASPELKDFPEDENPQLFQGFLEKYKINQPQQSPLVEGLTNFAERASFGIYNAPDVAPQSLGQNVGAMTGQLLGSLANVGTGTLAGAGAGAALGSIVPGLGTVAGGAVGGLIGGITGAGAGEFGQNVRDQYDRGVRQVNYGSASLAGLAGAAGQAVPGLGVYKKANNIGKLFINAGANAAIGAGFEAGDQLARKGAVYDPNSVLLSSAAGLGLGIAGEAVPAALYKGLRRLPEMRPRGSERPIGMYGLARAGVESMPQMQAAPMPQTQVELPSMSGGLQGRVEIQADMPAQAQSNADIFNMFFVKKSEPRVDSRALNVPRATEIYAKLAQEKGVQAADAWLARNINIHAGEMTLQTKSFISKLVKSNAAEFSQKLQAKASASALNVPRATGLYVKIVKAKGMQAADAWLTHNINAHGGDMTPQAKSFISKLVKSNAERLLKRAEPVAPPQSLRGGAALTSSSEAAKERLIKALIKANEANRLKEAGAEAAAAGRAAMLKKGGAKPPVPKSKAGLKGKAKAEAAPPKAIAGGDVQASLQLEGVAAINAYKQTVNDSGLNSILDTYAEAMANNKAVKALYKAEISGSRQESKPIEKLDLPYGAFIDKKNELSIRVINEKGQLTIRKPISGRGSFIGSAEISGAPFPYRVALGDRITRAGTPELLVKNASETVVQTGGPLTKTSEVIAKVKAMEQALANDSGLSEAATVGDIMRYELMTTQKNLEALIKKSGIAKDGKAPSITDPRTGIDC